MKITCDSDNDIRGVTINLPATPTKIAMFVSGGMDSAILYYLLLKANAEIGNIHQIDPFVISRTEGSQYFARLVIAHVHAQFNMSYKNPIQVGDPSLPGHLQVRSGGDSAVHMGYTQLYGGVIDQLEEHRIGDEPALIVEDELIKLPLALLNKGHVIDLMIKFNQQALFYITHSCSILEIGRCNVCNGCRERIWGFKQVRLADPGTI